MTLVRIFIISLGLFAAVAVSGAVGVIMTLLFSPLDEYERDLADREQLEYLEGWRNGKENE